MKMNKELGVNTTLSHYRIVSKIGAGGMGEVYLAKDTKLDRKVALKILPAEVAANDERMRRFVQEAKAAAALNHPNIAHIYEIGESDGVNFIAMEFIDGQTLRELMHGGQTDLAKLLRYLQHTAEGLAKAHAAGIVHRDLKPDNIMVTRDGHAKVLDFGLAKLIEAQAQPGQKPDREGGLASEVATAVMQQHSIPGMVMGTVGYMSPEQAQGRIKEIDARSDIFSFGCILFEAVTGRKAFEGKDAIDSLNRIIREPAPTISQFNPEAPADLQRIVRRCLAKDPDERYQTIKDVAIELKEVRHDLQGQEAHTTAPPSITSQAGPASQSFGSAASVTPDSSPSRVSSAEYVASQIKGHKVGFALALVLLAAAILGAGFGLYKFVNRSQPRKANSFAEAKLIRLTTSGKASDAAISPDGKWVAHVKSDAGQQSLWLRQVMTSSDTQIVPPSPQNYYGVTFSKDGNYIYYVQGEANNPATRTLYQVPVLGSASRKVIENVASPVSLSPDGARLAFVRGSPTQTALVVANVDGTGEREVAVRKLTNGTYSTGGPSWSPDGKRLASSVTVGPPNEAVAGSIVVEVQVESGAERPITSEKWPPATGTGEVAWLSDGSGLVVIAPDQGTFSRQLWHISYPGGEVRKITNDLNNYNRLSLTADSSALVTVQTEGEMNLWVAPQADAGRAKQISSGRSDGQTGLSWMPGGKIVYTSRGSGLTDIWSMEQDGKDQKQLTANAGGNVYPWATPDGRYIVFTSSRARRTRGIWRMDPDGGNLKQLTEGPGDIFPQSSPDGRWVVFQSTRSGSLRVWKVSIDGGELVRLSDKWTANPTVSPDGSLIACFYREDQANPPLKVAIIPFAGGDPVKVLDIPQSVNGPAGLRWTPDGRALSFVDTTGGVSNIWSLPLDGGKPVQLTDFKTDQIFWFDFSRDGKQLALSRGTQTSDVILIRDFR